MTLLSSHVFGSSYAKISDRVVSRPESANIDADGLKKIAVYEALEINGKEPERRKPKKSGDYPYVLVPAGKHRLKILKKRAWGPPNEKGEVLELNVSVKAGALYTIKDIGSSIELLQIENE